MSHIHPAEKKSISYQVTTFRFAFNGLKVFFQHETKSRIHLLFAFAAISMGILLEIRQIEWVVIIFSIGFVVTTEIFNTAIESIVDQLSPEKNKWAGITKDFSAAAVLIAAITALVAGIIIFLPKLLPLLNFIK